MVWQNNEWNGNQRLYKKGYSLDNIVYISVSDKNVTPYMHVLVAHLPKLMKDHGNIRMFSQQGLEKLNDDITKDYFKSTNHKSGEDSLWQILFKLNRLEYLTDQECIRIKHSHVCSKCKEVGHNSRTCPADNT